MDLLVGGPRAFSWSEEYFQRALTIPLLTGGIQRR
jgi:hypothetical protein